MRESEGGQPLTGRIGKLLMTRNRDHVYRVAREFLTRSEDVDRKANLAASVHDAGVAYSQAVLRLTAAYEAALEGGWSHGELGALGFSLPTTLVETGGRPTKIIRRRLQRNTRNGDAAHAE